MPHHLQGEQVGPVRSTPLCRSCHAPIIWAKTKTGKRIPLDPKPVIGGNLVLIDGVVGVTPPSHNVERYTSHFATCPNADEHRSKP